MARRWILSHSDIYSELKPAWWYLRDGCVPEVPKQIQLILSDLCNQNCSFCAYRMDGYSSNEMFMADAKPAGYGHNNPKRWIPDSKVSEILKDAARLGVKGIQFTGGGEPTVHPHHERLFQEALELGLKCALVSNGLHWSDPLISILEEFAWVRVSVDAGTPETYGKIRDTATGNFGKVWNNVARLAHGIRMEPWSPCVLGIGYVVTADNWHEIIDGVRLSRKSGAAYIRLSAVFSPEGAKPYENIYGPIKTLIHEARACYETEDFKVHDLFGDRLDDLEQGAPDYKTCYYQHYNSYIGGDQNVYRCCVLAYNKRGLLGSIKDRSYSDFIGDAETQKLLTNFDARGCERCQFNSKNKAMNYLLGDDPPHKEFP